MNYEFRLIPEASWVLVVVGVTTLAQIVTAADPSVVLADPRAWVISAAAAVIRAVLGKLLDVGGKV